MESQNTHIRSSLFLRIGFSKSTLNIYDGYELQDCILDDRRMLRVLERFRSGLLPDAASREVQDIYACTSDEARAFLDELQSVGLLWREDDNNRRVMSILFETWKSWNWEDAFWFHLAALDYPFLDYALPWGRKPDYELMRDYLKIAPVPQKYKEYPELKLIPFTPFAGENYESWDSLGFFETCSYENRKQTFNCAAFGDFLYLTVGQIGVKPWPDQGDFIRRTSPSGGARHPTEAYLAIFDVEGLAPSIAHYDVRQHGLNIIKEFENASELYNIICVCCPDVTSRLNGIPRVMVFFSSIFERAMWRYRDTRSHRVNYIDVGHIMFTARCVADYIGVNLYPGHGMKESELEALFKLDGVNEGMLAFCSLGVP